MEWLNGIVECVLQGEGSLPMQFPMSDLLEPLCLFCKQGTEGSKIAAVAYNGQVGEFINYELVQTIVQSPQIL